MLYLYKDSYFDNLEPLNWGKVCELLPIYRNKRLVTQVKRLKNNYEDGKKVRYTSA